MEGNVVEKVWISNLIDLDNLRIFYFPAYMHISSEDQSKLDSKLNMYVFVSYAKDVKGYKLWDQIKKKMLIDRDFVFDEQLM